MRELGYTYNRQNQWNGNPRQGCRNRNVGNMMNRPLPREEMDMVCDCKGSEKALSEECSKFEAPIDEMRPGMGYVPWQKFQQLLEAEEALAKGTMFQQLVLPYTGKQNGRGGMCNG